MTTEDNHFLYPDEPGAGGWSDIKEFNAFLRWISSKGISDIKVTPTDPVAARIDGKWRHITRRPMGKQDLLHVLIKVTNNQGASATLDGGIPLNFRYQILKDEVNKMLGDYRFRGNAAGASDGYSTAYAMTLRLIPDEIPELETLGVEPELIEHLFPDFGLVAISGVMGSGKTTTLASMIQHIRRTEDKAILTLESPVEFDYTQIPGARGTIEQTDVPTMIKSFSEGIISSTRRAEDVLLVGEINNRSSMEAAVHAGEVGIAVYCTLHTNSVASIPGRIIHQFTEDEAPGIAVALISASRLLMQQRLYPRKGGGRVAVRSWLATDESIRNHLIDVPHHDLQGELTRLVDSAGRTLYHSASLLHESGQLDDDAMKFIEKEYKLSMDSLNKKRA